MLKALIYSNKINILFFFTSIALCLSFNIVNLNLEKKYNKGLTAPVFNTTIWSIDNVFYLSPADNYIKTGEWKGNPSIDVPAVGSGTYFRRVPGYSIIYYAFHKLTNQKIAHLLLVIFQVFLYGLSSIAIFKILTYLVNNYLAAILALLYILIPWFYSYTFFTITEGLTPFLMIFYLYFLLKADNTSDLKYKNIYYIFATFFVCYAVFTRPSNGIAVIGLIIFFLVELKNQGFIKTFKLVLCSGIIPVFMFGSWALRNYQVTGELVFLEKGFHPQSLDRQKPEWEGLLNFTKCWAEDGAHFNTYNVPLYYNAIKGDTNNIYIQNTLKAWPDYVIEFYGNKNLYTILKRYQRVSFQQGKYYQQKIAMPETYSKEQLLLKKDFDKLSSLFKKEFPFQYYVKTPLNYLSDIIIHSNTSHLLVFQNQFRSYTILNLFRGALSAIHILIYLNIFLNFFLLRKDIKLLTLFAIIPLLYLIFFAFYFQLIEQRYMFPILPWVFIGIFKPASAITFFLKKLSIQRA